MTYPAHPEGATYLDTIAAYATIMLLDIYGTNDPNIERNTEYDEMCPNMPLEAMTAQAATIKQTLLDAVHGRS